ncbi:Vacuolar protein-sorting-associated protein 25 [Mortierella sp. AD094]|nr:Vacuolar protein-sorting-associated protein 25 [Mortierella sp. AD094]
MSTLYRFTTAQGLIHLLDKSNTSTTTSTTTTSSHGAIHPNLEIHSVHGNLDTNDHADTSLPSVTKNHLNFDHLVCDFDETITDHDTTSSFDALASKIRPEEYAEPQMTWPEILQAYLDDLEKVDVSDLCHLNNSLSLDTKDESLQQQNCIQEQQDSLHRPKPRTAIQPPSAKHRLLDPKVRELKCHIDGRTFTPEPELPVPKIPSLQPWVHSQVRKRAVEKVSLDRVYESGNLVGLTKPQIREYGRNHIRLRPGMVEFLRLFVQEQDKRESEGRRRGELWILSVNWSQDLIRGALDQIFGSEEATEKYLPESNLISSNLLFLKEDHHELIQRRRRSSAQSIEMVKGEGNSNGDTAAVDNKDRESMGSSGNSSNGNGDHEESVYPSSPSKADASKHLSNGKVKVHCLTGTDKLHAFQGIQRNYATKHDILLTDVKWAYLGDSSTDLGCLVEADVGIIVGKSKSLMTECEQSVQMSSSNAALGLSQSPALASGFQFPSIHNFPPFYTLQPTESTWKSQADLWSTIIMRYYRHHRLYQLDLDDTATNEDLFNNQRINRRLKPETIQAIVDEMVKKGDAEWDATSRKRRAIIYWRKPEDWASMISSWVFESGLNNSILTFYEIAHGDNSEDQEFYNIHPTVLQKTMDVLVKRGIAATFQGATFEEMGVKFFNAGA